MTVAESNNVVSVNVTKNKIARMLGKHGLNVPGFIGDRILTELFNSGKVKNVIDLFNLSEKDLRRVRGVGKQITGFEIYTSLQNNKRTTLPQFISGLGIPGVNITKATILAKHFPVFGKLVNADIFDLRRINCLTEQTINNILEYFNDDDNIDFIYDLRETIGITW